MSEGRHVLQQLPELYWRAGKEEWKIFACISLGVQISRLSGALDVS